MNELVMSFDKILESGNKKRLNYLLKALVPYDIKNRITEIYNSDTKINYKNLEKRVISCISVVLGLDEKLINENSNENSLHIDSLDRIELIMNLEDEFDLYFNDDELTKLNTVGDIVTLIKMRIE